MDDNQRQEEHKRKIRELDHARRAFFIVIVAWCVFAFVWDADSQSQRWNTTPQLVYDHTNSPYHSAFHVEEALEYAVWTWNSRVDLDIRYVGLTLAPVERGIITFKWISALDMFLWRDSHQIGGVTQSWYYLDGSGMARAVVSLNIGYFQNKIDACQMTIITHELGHGLGIMGHSTNSNDLMYHTQRHCRYTPSNGDIALTKYKKLTCHAEYNREGDIYIPSIDGHRAMLRKIDINLWDLAYLERDGSQCAATTIDDELNFILHDLRSIDGKVRAEFRYEGNDTWRLVWAG